MRCLGVAKKTNKNFAKLATWRKWSQSILRFQSKKLHRTDIRP